MIGLLFVKQGSGFNPAYQNQYGFVKQASITVLSICKALISKYSMYKVQRCIRQTMTTQSSARPLTLLLHTVAIVNTREHTYIMLTDCELF